MVNQFSSGMPNAAQYPIQDYQNIQTGNASSPSIITPIIGGVVAGSAIGGTVGFFRKNNPVTANGEVSDSFVKKAFEKHINKNLSDDLKQAYKQKQEFLNKLIKLKDIEKFKNLLKENSAILNLEKIGIKTSDFFKSINSENFKNLKNITQNFLEADIKNHYQFFKQYISACWDSTKKKFVKPEFVDDKIFKVIKNTSNGNKWKSGLKYGAAGGAIIGTLIAGYNYFAYKKIRSIIME